jgi:hypothetical protein
MGLELRNLCRAARNQLLYWLSYPSSIITPNNRQKYLVGTLNWTTNIDEESIKIRIQISVSAQQNFLI